MSDTVVSMSKALALSYIIDWVFIIGVALIGFGFSRITPNHRPFSLTDAHISLPYVGPPTVSIGTVAVVALIVPAVIIALVSILWFPGSQVAKITNRSLAWRYKLWEWHAGWLGLGVAVVGAFMSTEGLKDLYGKPRPDMLDRCNPDLSKVAMYAVSGLGARLANAPTLVTWEICQNKSDILKVKGFSSFPSGHTTFSFAGLTYLSLWLCSKFSVTFPYLPVDPSKPEASGQRNERYRILSEEPDLDLNTRRNKALSIPAQGAAPPVYLMIIAFVPFAVACFITASRWFDHQHDGFDILFSSIMGNAFAWLGFRMYNLPPMRSAGWSWGVRHSQHAFFKDVGFPSHAGNDSWGTGSREVLSTGADVGQPNICIGNRGAAEVRSEGL